MLVAEKEKEYSSEDIECLSDRDHVRLRLPVYAGSTNKKQYNVLFVDENTIEVKTVEFIPAIYKLICEITENCKDELSQIAIPQKKITIKAEPDKGVYEIRDNGRGIPIDKHSSGQYTPQVVFATLRSGRNFKDNKQQNVIGTNGMGSAIVNYCSEYFNTVIFRDDKRYSQRFKDGGLKIGKPSITDKPDQPTGTQVKFKLDETVFNDVSLSEELTENWAKEIAFTNPNVQVQYNNKRFKYKNGVEDLLKKYCKNNGCTLTTFEQSTDRCTIKLNVITGESVADCDDIVFCYVNSGYLFDGGICNTQILNRFSDCVVSHLQPQCKKSKCRVERQDINHNCIIIADIKCSDPEYDAQSKLRLTGPNLRQEINKIFQDNWSQFARKNKKWLEEVFERGYNRYHMNASKQAVKDQKRKSRKKIAKLTECNSKVRDECSILITEGDSASAMVTDVRDPSTTACFPLSGKINNVWGMKAHQVLELSKLSDVLSALGLVPGDSSIDNLRYGKIVIATDADPDGSNINALLVNLFYAFWPDLFDKDNPKCFRLIVPNVVASKGTKRIHYKTRQEYQQSTNKHTGYEIEYMKGLGSMLKQDWKLILSDLDNHLIPIVDDGEMQTTLELLFGPDSDKRKLWLQGE